LLADTGQGRNPENQKVAVTITNVADDTSEFVAIPGNKCRLRNIAVR